MPTRIPWMTGVDRLILEWLGETDIIITPKLLYENLERDLSDPELPSEPHLARRVRYLEDVGILEMPRRGKYMLSDLGRRFLADELSEDEREYLITLELVEDEDAADQEDVDEP